jgi:hypothetical protein
MARRAGIWAFPFFFSAPDVIAFDPRSRYAQPTVAQGGADRREVAPGQPDQTHNVPGAE